MTLHDDAATITTHLDTIRRAWPHMLPGIRTASTSTTPPKGHGHTSNPRGLDNGDHNDDTDRLNQIISARADIHTVLYGWAKVVLEDINPDTPPPAGDNPIGLCTYLADNALHLVGHEAAQDILDELGECARTAHHIVTPKRRTTITIGDCPIGGCQGTVRAHPTWRDDTTGDAWATCDTCETRAVAAWWRDKMGLTHREQLTAAELVTLARTEYGIGLTHRAVQGLVRRRTLVPIDEQERPQRFRLADCVWYLTRRAG